MAEKITIIYLTDGRLSANVSEMCQYYLLQAVGNKRLLSVSQEPMSFAENICVGSIGYSGLSIDRQIWAGLEQVKTEYVAIAEHDCIYSSEHFNWTPPDNKHFWYNTNCWLLQLGGSSYPEYDGMFSFIKHRYVQSQLICSTDALRKAEESKLEILSDPTVIETWPVHSRIGEPGTNWLNRSKRVIHNDHLSAVWEKLKAYITEFNAKDFSTVIPNIDIRHGQNFTGPRRGKYRRWSLDPWGTLADIVNRANMTEA